MYPIESHYRYNICHIVEEALIYDLEVFVNIGLDKDEWSEANYFALLTMKRNCKKQPYSFIEMSDYAFEVYELL